MAKKNATTREITLTPKLTPLPNGDDGMNAAALLRLLFEIELGDVANRVTRSAIGKWQERVAAVRHACCIMACPPTLDELLWEHGHGDEVERCLLDAWRRRHGDARGLRFGAAPVNVFDLVDVIVREPAYRETGT